MFNSNREPSPTANDSYYGNSSQTDDSSFNRQSPASGRRTANNPVALGNITIQQQQNNVARMGPGTGETDMEVYNDTSTQASDRFP